MMLWTSSGADVCCASCLHRRWRPILQRQLLQEEQELRPLLLRRRRRQLQPQPAQRGRIEVRHSARFHQHHAGRQHIDQGLQLVVGPDQVCIEGIDLSGQLFMPALQGLGRRDEELKGVGKI